MESPKSINPLSLKSTLTLRYDISQKPILPKLEWTDFSNTSNVSIDTLENLIEKSILNSVNGIEPKKIAISLSGGIDSSLVLLFLKKVLPNSSIKAFSIKFADSVDETPRSKEIANHFDVSHEIISVDDYFKKLPLVISQSGLPFWDIHWYYVAEKVKSYSNFLASGDGGDELFGGYTFRYSKFLKLVNSNSTPLDKVKAYLQCHERDHVPDQTALFGKKSHFGWSEIYQFLVPYFDNSLDLLEQVFLADYNGKLLYNFSIFNSNILESLNINPLTPLISKEIIYASLRIPSNQKYDSTNNMGKLPLRNILHKYKIMHLIDNQKLGFSVNTINLWKKSGKEICKQFLIDSNLVKQSWISKDWILSNIDKKDLETRYVNKFFGLLAFEIWYRINITHEMSGNENI